MSGFRRNKEAISRVYPRRSVRWHAPPVTPPLIFVRSFDGATDNIACSIGNLANLRDGDLTIAALVKVASDVDAGIIEFHGSPDLRCGLVRGGNNYPIGFQDNAGGQFVGPPPAFQLGVWCVVCITRLSGVLRAHIYNFDTDTWGHVNGPTVNAVEDTLTSVRIGGLLYGGGDYNGLMGVAAAKAATALSDVQIESLATGLQEWVDVFTGDSAVWPLTQESTATPVEDIVGSADETALTGTTVVQVPGPTGFNWELGAGAQNILPSGIGSAQAFGTATVARGAVTAQPSGIASAEVFGTPRIVRAIQPGGIASAQAFGTPNVQRVIKPTGIASAEAFGTAKTIRNIVPSGIASAQAFGTATVANVKLILPSGIASAQAFGTPTVTPGVATILPSGIASAQAFGTAKIIRTIFPTGIASAEAFGTPLIVRRISPTGIASAQVFGTPLIVRVVKPTSIASAEAFGTATIVKGAVTISPSGIASGQAFGNALISAGALIPPGVVSAEAFGTARVTITRIYGTGIPSAQAFGTPRIVRYVLPVSIGSGQAFGTATIQPGVRTVSPTGIASAQAFGVPRIAKVVLPTGIASAQAFGTARVTITRIYATGIPSAQVFGTASVGGLGALFPVGIPSGLAFGVPKLSRLITASGIPPAEAFGVPLLRRQVLVVGILSGQTFGIPTIAAGGEGLQVADVFISKGGITVTLGSPRTKTSTALRGPTVTVR